MNKIIIQAALVSGLLFVSTMHAETNSYDILTTKIDTLESGFDITYDVSKTLNVHLSANNLINDTINKKEIDSIDNFSLLNDSTIIDYSPFKTHLRLSTELFNHYNTLNIASLKNNNVMIGKKIYNLNNAFTPYLGLDWNEKTNKTNQSRFSLDAEVFSQPNQGKVTSVSAINSNPIALNNVFQNDLQQETKNFSHKQNSFQALPVISLETSYRF